MVAPHSSKHFCARVALMKKHCNDGSKRISMFALPTKIVMLTSITTGMPQHFLAFCLHVKDFSMPLTATTQSDPTNLLVLALCARAFLVPINNRQTIRRKFISTRKRGFHHTLIKGTNLSFHPLQWIATNNEKHRPCAESQAQNPL